MHRGKGHWNESIENSEKLQVRNKPKWEAMISCLVEPSLEEKTILDFGCNLGGFLKVLYDRFPFKSGVGVDIRPQFLEYANKHKDAYPVEYVDAGMLAQFAGTFHVAFSHEVIHLVGNLAEHASLIKTVLKPGASYYVVRSFSKPEIWDQTKEAAQQHNLTVSDLTPQSVVDTFEQAGYEVSVRLLPFNWFAPCGREVTADYDGLKNMLEHYSQRKLIFRFINNS